MQRDGTWPPVRAPPIALAFHIGPWPSLGPLATQSDAWESGRVAVLRCRLLMLSLQCNGTLLSVLARQHVCSQSQATQAETSSTCRVKSTGWTWVKITRQTWRGSPGTTPEGGGPARGSQASGRMEPERKLPARTLGASGGARSVFECWAG